MDTRGILGKSAQRLQSDEFSNTRIRLGFDYPVHKILGFEWQFCLLPLFALARFGVSVGNPRSGGDRYTIAIDRHCEVVKFSDLSRPLYRRGKNKTDAELEIEREGAAGALRQAAAEGLSLVPSYNQALTPSYPTLPHKTPPDPAIPHHTPPYPPLPYPTPPHPTLPHPTPSYPRLASGASDASRALLGRGSPAHTHN